MGGGGGFGNSRQNAKPPCIHSFHTWTYISDSSFSPWRFQKHTRAEIGEVLCKWFHSQNTSLQLSVHTLPLHISSWAMLWELCYTPNNKWLGGVQTTSNASTIMSDPLRAAVSGDTIHQDDRHLQEVLVLNISNLQYTILMACTEQEKTQWHSAQ